MQKIHLICNAHLDPVWLWQWEEGAAEALSTFRIAADFCEQYDGFIFNHNEAILYEWVEEYDAELFERIRKLVKAGKWHIMGGWYLQPDCNLPSGEGIVRQILAGQKYFREKFAVAPKVGINFDPFGHSRGMVQMLKQCGYTGYMFCKPQSFDRELPDEHFCWVGLDGSELMAARADDLYLSLRGTARAKVEENMKKHSHRPVHFVLWGVGNHGGGPLRIDLKNLGKLIEETTDCEILHSTPENFFADLSKHYENLPKVEHSINHYSVGCYSSAAHIKQTYRALENELFATEKILSSAVLHGLLKYPHKDLATAQRDLLFAQFHDILPGSMTKASQDAALRGMEHGREILSRLKARAFFALAKDQKLPAAADSKKDLAMTVINDGTYASDCKNDELRLTLFCSPAFTGHPLPGRTILPTDRFTLRMDQGEHVFNFTVNAGKISERFDNVDREAAVINEKPFAVSFFPNGCGKSYSPAVKLSDKTVQLSAVKFAENNNDLIVRMYEPTGKKRTTMLTISTHNIKHKVTLKPYEIVTLKINLNRKKITQTNLIEE